jgi:exosome complex component CSL4
MSGKSAERRDKLVFPGDELAVIEEFLQGPGSYEQDGVVRSSELGQARLDLDKREVEVSKRTKELILPLEGLDIVGEVGAVQRRMANVDVFIIDGLEIVTPYTGVIHISNISSDYVKNMGLAVRSGDLVKAKIINTKNRIVQLSIEGADYGIVYAFCSRCGATLEHRKTRLHCPQCGRVERRKMAKTYGTEELI